MNKPRLKISIGPHTLEAPFWISGDGASLLSLARQISEVAHLDCYTAFQVVGDEAQMLADIARSEREREDRILTMADTIKAKRAAEVDPAGDAILAATRDASR